MAGKKYHFPYDPDSEFRHTAVEIDGIRIERSGEAVELTQDQVKRVKDMGLDLKEGEPKGSAAPAEADKE